MRHKKQHHTGKARASSEAVEGAKTPQDQNDVRHQQHPEEHPDSLELVCYYDNVLDENARQRVQNHLDTNCQRCLQELSFLRLTEASEEEMLADLINEETGETISVLAMKEKLEEAVRASFASPVEAPPSRIERISNSALAELEKIKTELLSFNPLNSSRGRWALAVPAVLLLVALVPTLQNANERRGVTNYLQSSQATSQQEQTFRSGAQKTDVGYPNSTAVRSVQPRLRAQISLQNVGPEAYEIYIEPSVGNQINSLPVKKVGDDILEIVWPKGVELVRGQKYNWWLRPVRTPDSDANLKGTESPFEFTVLSAASLANVQREEELFKGDPVRVAALYLKNGLYAEAWPQLQAIASGNLAQVNRQTYDLAQRAAALLPPKSGS